MTTNNYPSVLTFEKKIVPSSALFYGASWEDRNESYFPLEVNTKTANKKQIVSDDESLLSKTQIIEYSALSAEQDTLRVAFTLKFLGGFMHPSSCDSEEFRLDLLEKFSPENMSEHLDESLKTLGKRYAYNIANGRFLWRNRVAAQDIEVQVDVVHGMNSGKKRHPFIFQNIHLNNFEESSDQINELGNQISNVLASQDEVLILEISCFVNLGRNQDVYPSVEMIQNKGALNDTENSRSLYQVDGTVALHSQKIGNALRTIDTWYPAFEKSQKPIAIEPFGTVATVKEAFRNKENENDFYTLMHNFLEHNTLSKNGLSYLIAVLIRGGIFGGKGE